MNKKLENMINSFLETRKKNDGTGWPEVTKKEMSDLGKIINLITELKYEKDCDGDKVIEFILINRTRQNSIPYYPLPYSHEIKTMKEFDDSFDLAHLNFDMAKTEFDFYCRTRKNFAERLGKKNNEAD